MKHNGSNYGIDIWGACLKQCTQAGKDIVGLSGCKILCCWICKMINRLQPWSLSSCTSKSPGALHSTNMYTQPKCYRPTPCHIDRSAMRDRSWLMWSFTIWFFFSTSCSIIVSQKGLPAFNLAGLIHFSLTSERGLFFLMNTLCYAYKLLLGNPTSKTPCNHYCLQRSQAARWKDDKK